MRIFLLLLLFTFTNSFSQDFLVPKEKKSFGLNRHTNRDISYFSNIDSNNDIIITATTERDSTYTDILVTKLDKDLNLIWKKRYSVGMYTSYDSPLATHIDKNNNIIIICRSLVNNLSNSTGILFAVCYSPDGTELWHLNFDDPNTPKNYNYYYQKSFLDENNILHVVNSVNKDGAPNKIDVNFYSINSSGNIIEKFTRDDLVQYNGYFNVFNKFYYYDGVYYMILKSYVMNTNEPDLYIKKIDKNSLIDLSINPIIDISDTDAYEDSDLQVDKNKNVFLSYSSYKKGFINVLKFDSSLKLIYKTSTTEQGMRHIMSSSLNADGQLQILNNIDKGAINNSPQLSLLEFDDNGLVHKETVKNDIDILLFKKNEDKSFFIETKNGDIKLFDENINLINDFKGTGLDIDDICKLDNGTLVLAGTSYGKAYPTSDYLTELDLIVQKINKDELIGTYHYSGEGTSKAYSQKIVIDNKDNYIVASEEKLGPDNLEIGGSRAPMQRSLYKYDSNLNLLWILEIPYEIVTPLSFEDKNILVDSQNSIYINGRTENNTYKLLKISEQGSIVYDQPSYPAVNLYFDKDKNINVVSLPVSNQTTYDDDTTIYTLSSVNGKLLNAKLFQGVEYLGNYNDKEGDSYIYMFPGNNNPYNNTNPRIEVYKNLNLEFERKISLEGTYAGIMVHSIDKNGTLFFSSSYGQVEYKLHRLNLSNEYKFINLEKNINRILCTAEGKNFMITENHDLSIYNKDLEVLANGSENYSGYGSLFELGNYVLINTPWDNVVKVVDKNAQLIRSFKLPSALSYTNSAKDSKNSLILTGKNGDRIYTYSEYSWWRGFLHKYDILDMMLGIDDFDKNVFRDDLSIYPNPSTSIVNITADNEDIVKLQLYDLSGELILNQFSTNKMDISKLPNALYFMKVQLTNDKVFYKKIIKN